MGEVSGREDEGEEVEELGEEAKAEVEAESSAERATLGALRLALRSASAIGPKGLALNGVRRGRSGGPDVGSAGVDRDEYDVGVSDEDSLTPPGTPGGCRQPPTHGPPRTLVSNPVCAGHITAPLCIVQRRHSLRYVLL